jgi:glutathione S-transferase
LLLPWPAHRIVDQVARGAERLRTEVCEELVELLVQFSGAVSAAQRIVPATGAVPWMLPGALMSVPRVFGATYSVYVRIVRLTLVEKAVPYELVEVDVFAPGGPPPAYLARHPFGRIPAFEHDGFRLYETAAIARYVDEAFAGPALQPADARGRARMNQIISLLDNYAYRPLVWDLFVERVRAPAQRRPPDEARIAAALPGVETCFDALVDLMAEDPYLAGTHPTLADLHAAPMFIYACLAPEAAARLHQRPALAAWLARLVQRPSVAATRSPFEPPA